MSTRQRSDAIIARDLYRLLPLAETVAINLLDDDSSRVIEIIGREIYGGGMARRLCGLTGREVLVDRRSWWIAKRDAEIAAGIRSDDANLSINRDSANLRRRAA